MPAGSAAARRLRRGMIPVEQDDFPAGEVAVGGNDVESDALLCIFGNIQIDTCHAVTRPPEASMIDPVT